jgi:hypothetical protein
MTTGAANRFSESTYHGKKMSIDTANFMLQSNGSPKSQTAIEFYKDQKMMTYGNHSKDSKTWIAGPRHETREQNVPGYTGFIRGKEAENVFAKSFAKATSKSLAGRIPTGADLSPNQRFTSQNMHAFSPKNFRRTVENPELEVKRDYLEYARAVNLMNTNEKNKFLSTLGSTGETFTNYSGMRTTKIARGRNETLNHTVDLSGTTIKSPKNNHLSFFGIREGDVQVKPKLFETKIAQKEDFMGLSDGFKRSFANDTNDQKNFKIPVVGYTGHRKGEKSENMIG